MPKTMNELTMLLIVDEKVIKKKEDDETNSPIAFNLQEQIIIKNVWLDSLPNKKEYYSDFSLAVEDALKILQHWQQENGNLTGSVKEKEINYFNPRLVVKEEVTDSQEPPIQLSFSFMLPLPEELINITPEFYLVILREVSIPPQIDGWPNKRIIAPSIKKYNYRYIKLDYNPDCLTILMEDLLICAQEKWLEIKAKDEYSEFDFYSVAVFRILPLAK